MSDRRNPRTPRIPTDASPIRADGHPAAYRRGQIAGHIRMYMGLGNAHAAGTLTGVLVTVLCTGCAAAIPSTADHSPPAAARSAQDTQPGAYPTGRTCPPDAHLPHASLADGHTPDTAVAAWARMAYSLDTICDASPHDALVRSAVLMAPGLAGLVRRQRPVNSPGAVWNQMAAHRAWTTVTTSSTGAERPADTPLLAHRGVRIHSAAHGRDHWTGTGPEDVAYCTLTRNTTGAPWRISELSIQSTR